jgi:hypothetical protein
MEAAVHGIHGFQDSVPLTEATFMQSSKFESVLLPVNRLCRPQRGFKITDVAYCEYSKCAPYSDCFLQKFAVVLIASVGYSENQRKI